MRLPSLLSRLLGGPSAKALAHAHEQAEVARLSAINRDPPPGEGWRVADQDSEGKWTVWNGPRPIASFWDENEAAEWARGKNADPIPNRETWDDGKYCVNCGSHETDDSLKRRGFVSCCPERYVIPESWTVTADRLATGQFHIWRAPELPTITDDGWPERADAQAEADRRNLKLHRAHAAIATSQPEHPGPDPETLAATRTAPFPNHDNRPVIVGNPDKRFLPYDRTHLDERTAPVGRILTKQERLAEFLDVPIPEGVRAVVGPRKSPDDGNWWVFTRAGPYRGYTRKANAQAAAERVNNAPQT